jgi:hypothetical protein
MCIIEMEAYGTITSSTTSTSSSSSVTIVAYERQMKEMAIRVAAGMTHTIDDMYCCSFYFISYCCWVLFGHPPPPFSFPPLSHNRYITVTAIIIIWGSDGPTCCEMA